MSVIIDSSLHLFRSESELKNEAKGGYLNGKIILPSSAIGSDLELALYDTNGLPHPNKLFITPLNKRQNNTEKYVTPLVTDRNLKLLYQNNNYVVDTKNHPYLSRLVENGEQIVGAGFFDHQNNQFYLGLSGLKLTVMNDIKKGKKSALEYSKVKLGMKVLNDPEKTYFSSIIQDSKYYDLKLEEVDQKEDLVTVTFKKGNGQLIKSMISKMSLKMAIGDQQILSEDHDIKSQKQVQFKNVEKRFDHPLSKENILVEIEYKDKSKKCYAYEQIVKVKDLKRKITDTSNNPDEPKKMKMDYGNSLECKKDQDNSLILENSQLKTCLKLKEEEIDNLKQEIHELKTRLNIQEQENLHLRNENIDELKSNQESVEKENHELKTRLALLEQEKLQLRNENAILRDQQLPDLIGLLNGDIDQSILNDVGEVDDDGSEEQNLDDSHPVLDKSNDFTSIGVVTLNHEPPKEVLKKANNNKPMLVKENECKKKPIILWSENGVDLKLDTWSVIDSIRKEMKSMECTPKNGILSKENFLLLMTTTNENGIDLKLNTWSVIESIRKKMKYMECTPKNGILSKENFLLLMISKNWRTFYQLHKNLMSQWMIHCFFHTIKKNERIFMMDLRNRNLPFKKGNIFGLYYDNKKTVYQQPNTSPGESFVTSSRMEKMSDSFVELDSQLTEMNLNETQDNPVVVQCKLCGEKYPDNHLESHVVGVHGLDGPKEMYIDEQNIVAEKLDEFIFPKANIESENLDLSDQELVKMPLTQLNKFFKRKGISKERAREIKFKRRSLLNRGYAASVRMRHEAYNAKLKKEYGWLISSIEDFNQQLENYSMDDQQRFRDLRRIFKNRIDAQRSETEQETKQKLKKEYGWLYNTSIEDFNQQLENYSMDDQQRFRDLRRRFKNRDAAMKSRLKRMNEFKELQLLKNLISSA